ncbi:D-aminoacyl-tRNA deacylase [Oceanobacillus halotolerans]|uniref:D-aminoacyl-tRNA deacylase n=1 Tax=Oceanobacillus halotolerans TaxID=2663380 RepID=UPI0013D9D688|nr:D-aminoacyl-tRNA deacylase [Oceanobacillus halotolerans]
MRAVIQRAKNASVTVEDEVVGQIANGLVVLLGVTHDDQEEDVDYIVRKLVHLRIFEDDDGKMNDSLINTGGSVLSISQFTLYADTRKGRRPSYIQAAKPDVATQWYNQFNKRLLEEGVRVETGQFGEMMDVRFTNVGPVTIILDSKDK